MEKKKYAEPETEIIVFQTLDVMCASNLVLEENELPFQS